MKLSEFKNILETIEAVRFKVNSTETVPEHFHITEVGSIRKHFIDCGGKVRHQETANFQLWDSDDYEHRLNASKLLRIIRHSEELLGMNDLEIEVEYQTTTIGKYDLDFDGSQFLLIPKQTACLAKENCGNVKTGQMETIQSKPLCTPGGGCC